MTKTFHEEVEFHLVEVCDEEGHIHVLRMVSLDWTKDEDEKNPWMENGELEVEVLHLVGI